MTTKKQFKLSERGFTGGLSVDKLRIDKAKGIIYNVKLLGKKSKNGGEYLPSAHNSVIKLAEGGSVFFDHPTPEQEKQGGRSFLDRFGRTVGLYKQNGETFAKEFRYNPKHRLAEQFLWFAENDPNGIGFSINGSGSGYEQNGTRMIEQVTKFISFDIVDNPGTTHSLYEQTRNSKMGKLKEQDDTTTAVIPDASIADSGDHMEHLANAVKALADDLAAGNLDKEEVRTKINSILDMLGEDAEPEETEDTEKMMEQLRVFNSKPIKWAVKLIEGSIKEQTLQTRLEVARKSLPETAITEQFKNQLRRAESDDEVTELIKDRKSLVGKGKPTSHPPTGTKVILPTREQSKNGSGETVEKYDENKLKELAKKEWDSDD